MRKYTVYIPTFRTPIEPQRSILEPVKEEWIAGAALDVFDQEPLPLDSLFRAMDKVVITPHIGGTTFETR
ncbi:MAG: NAD(P)-dependent oxidoreductase [Thermodesulfobacteriota bacterium]|nr:NAD(P)-dependent oxidoreductase [Thermodesulfobacteriota bacterium]